MGRPRAEARRVRADPRDPRPPADQLGAGDVLRDVERALLLQVVQGAPQAVLRDPAGDAGRQDARRHRRERRRHRHRPGLRRHVQGRVAQPPVVRRALPGRRDRRRRHRPRHPRHGRPAGGGDGPAAVRPARRRRHPPGAARDRGRRRRLRQLPRPAQHRRRGRLRPRRTSATRSSTRSASACCGTRTSTSPRRPASATRSSCTAPAPAATASAASRVLASETFDADGPGEAAERAGRRPVHGEAAHRVHPRDLRRRPGRRHPGPRRRRALVRDLRAGERRRRRHARSSSTGCRCATPRSRPRRS